MNMQDTDIDQRFSLARSIAEEAGRLALGYFENRGSLVIETKRDLQDVVSIADRNVETLIRDRVAAAFPQDGFLGEEFGHVEGSSGFTWVVDPIDGTAPFVNGM
ncbi:MAG TPA: inositol monophosphatase family protein, partial [Rhizobium sp.]|nr:inositol monophosphatase family protein [Rhizobium sp.]